jgi:hypothetical protein
MSYLVAAEILLELVVVAEWFGLPETKDRTIVKAAKMIVPVEIAESGLGLVAGCGCQKFGRNWFDIVEAMLIIVFYCWILAMFFSFWAHFGAMAPAMISKVEVWIYWIVVLHFWGSSSSRRKTSSCAWSIVLVELRVFHIVGVSWSLELSSPCCSSIALSS